MSSIVEVRQFLATPEPPGLGPGPRPGVRSAAEVRGFVERLDLAEARGGLMCAALLLWHDHLDAAHGIVQDIESADGSYLHAILHRREPDFGNARYWFRRAGEHRCHRELASRVRDLLGGEPRADIESRLLAGGKWDAFQFVELCESAARGRGAHDALLREIQKIEFEVVVDFLGSR